MKHLITLGFLLLALVCYGIGLVNAANFFILLGAIAETVFWVRVLRTRRQAKA